RGAVLAGSGGKTALSAGTATCYDRAQLGTGEGAGARTRGPGTLRVPAVRQPLPPAAVGAGVPLRRLRAPAAEGGSQTSAPRAAARGRSLAQGIRLRLRRVAPEEAAPIEVDLQEPKELRWVQRFGESSLVVVRPSQAPALSLGTFGPMRRRRRPFPGNTPSA